MNLPVKQKQNQGRRDRMPRGEWERGGLVYIEQRNYCRAQEAIFNIL